MARCGRSPAIRRRASPCNGPLPPARGARPTRARPQPPPRSISFSFCPPSLSVMCGLGAFPAPRSALYVDPFVPIMRPYRFSMLSRSCVRDAAGLRRQFADLPPRLLHARECLELGIGDARQDVAGLVQVFLVTQDAEQV